MRRRAGRRALGIAAALCILGLLAGAEQGPPAGREVVLRGTVTDETGAPLSGYPIRFLQTKTTLNLFRFTVGSQQLEAARAETDTEGHFELTLVPDPRFDYFYLRFYDPRSFDSVRYRVPADVDVTRPMKQRTQVVVDQIIRDHPDWPRVKALQEEFGADSNRGRILRSLGLPERRETFANSPGRENWWYYAKGLCYQLRADEILRVRRYDPVIPPRPSA